MLQEIYNFPTHWTISCPINNWERTGQGHVIVLSIYSFGNFYLWDHSEKVKLALANGAIYGDLGAVVPGITDLNLYPCFPPLIDALTRCPVIYK